MVKITAMTNKITNKLWPELLLGINFIKE